MKKTIILLLLSCSTIVLHAQDLEPQSIDCNAIAKSIVSKIKKYSQDNLLPYYDKKSKQWGFMTKDGKILTEPLTDRVLRFDRNMHDHFSLYDFKGCNISINMENYTFTAKKVDNAMSGEMRGESRYRSEKPAKGFTIKTSTGINPKTGEVSQEAEITAFSNIYWTVFSPLKYNDTWYAIAKLKGTWKQGIIDQDGNTLPNFDFQYKELIFLKNYKTDNSNERWFYFEIDAENRGFTNLEGETKFKNELLSSYGDYLYYPYSIQKNTEKSGILDLRTLTWTIEPQTKFKNFEQVIRIGQSNDAITYYIVVADGEEKYLIDMNKKVYKPKR